MHLNISGIKEHFSTETGVHGLGSKGVFKVKGPEFKKQEASSQTETLGQGDHEGCPVWHLA